MPPSSEKSFVCSVCSARFSLKAHLGRHRQTHDKSKLTYPCTKCKIVAFERKDFLLRHEKTCGKGRRSKLILKQDDFIQEARDDPTAIVNEHSASGTNINLGAPYAENSAVTPIGNASDSSSFPSSSQGISTPRMRLNATYPLFFTPKSGYYSSFAFGDTSFTDDLTSSYVPFTEDISIMPTLPPSIPAEGLPSSSSDFFHNDKFLSNFLKYHCRNYPFFHVPTFRQLEAHPLLLRAMSAAGAIYPDDTLETTQASYSHSIRELKGNLRHLLFSYWCDAAKKADYMLQYQLVIAMGIVQCLGMTHADPLERQTTIAFHFMAIMMLKQSNITERVKSYVPPSLSSQSLTDDSTWRAWVTNEMSKRIIFLIRGMDAFLPGLFGLPPLIPSSEIIETDVPLPCDELLWKAKSSKEWADCILRVALPTHERDNPCDSFMFEEYLKGASFVAERRTLFGYGFGREARRNLRLWQFNSYASFIYILEFMRDIYDCTSGISAGATVLPLTSSTISKAISNWYTKHLTFYTSGYWSRPSPSTVTDVSRDFTFGGIPMYYATVYVLEDPKRRLTADQFDKVIKWLWAEELAML